MEFRPPIPRNLATWGWPWHGLILEPQSGDSYIQLPNGKTHTPPSTSISSMQGGHWSYLWDIGLPDREATPDEIEQGDDDFMVCALIQDLVETMEERSELMAQEKQLKERLEKIQHDLLQELGEDPRRIGYPEGVLEVNAGRVSNRFDRKAFAAEYPDLESKFIVESVGKPTVSFKAVS